ncbi:MAG: glutathione peroxidase [Acidiferrobacterales bacterium]|nr:glutathione peroxidase [Acidiferrobacterales bacterium]
MSAHDFEFKDIDGRRLPLSKFARQPMFIVNTASECGFTPQYAELQELWSRYRKDGLIVLGVPSNDFGGQEPGDETDIKKFCSAHYRIDFPMTAKQTVIGGEAHPFYRWIVGQLGEAAAPRWNFHKYLIASDGTLASLWPSKVSPLDSEVVAAIEKLLPRAS